MIKLGYHSATWSRAHRDLTGDHAFLRALDEMAMDGWDGVELAGGGIEVLKRLNDDPVKFAEYLRMHGLELATWYCSLGFLDPAKAEEEYERAVKTSDFLQAAGSSVLLLDGGTKRPEGNTDDDIKVVAEMCNRIGEMSKARGLKCCWHQHWGSMFEMEAPFEKLLQWTDPKLLHFCPDTGQLALGDFNVCEFIERHKHRVGYVHFKDLDRGGHFIEPGAGTIDFARVWQSLQSANYSGWLVVDLDYTRFGAQSSSQLCMKHFQELGIWSQRDIAAGRGGVVRDFPASHPYPR